VFSMSVSVRRGRPTTLHRPQRGVDLSRTLVRVVGYPARAHGRLAARLRAQDELAEARSWAVERGRWGSRTVRDPRADALRNRAEALLPGLPSPGGAAGALSLAADGVSG
jgi:hypothetical protein